MTNQQSAVQQQPVVANIGGVSATPNVAGSVGNVSAPVAPVSLVTRVLGEGARRNSEWYLSREGDLAVVTNEDSNMALGIKRIIARPGSLAQQANYVIANITLDTLLGEVRGVQIRESKQRAGEIYLQESSRNIAKEGQDAKWLSDLKLSEPVKAQILSFVHELLVPVEQA